MTEPNKAIPVDYNMRGHLPSRSAESRAVSVILKRPRPTFRTLALLALLGLAPLLQGCFPMAVVGGGAVRCQQAGGGGTPPLRKTRPNPPRQPVGAGVGRIVDWLRGLSQAMAFFGGVPALADVHGRHVRPALDSQRRRLPGDRVDPDVGI